MKMLINHISNTFNYGSFMMGINIINYINLINNNIEITYYTDIKDIKNIERLIKETKYKNIKIIRDLSMQNNNFNKINVFQRLINFKNKLNFEIKIYINLHIKNIITIGGDDLSEYYSGRMIALELYKIKIMSNQLEIILLGQTIGPFYSWRKILARLCLNKINIYTRDHNNFNYLKNIIKLKNVKESRDLAWLDLPRQNDEKVKNNILNKYNLMNNEYIVIVPSGLYKHYTINKEIYIITIINIIKYLCKLKIIKDKKIILFPHVLIPEKVDDRNIIREIEKKIQNNIKKKLTFIYDEMLATEARLILGNGLFTITGRMHGALSTFQMGKPALSLSYSVKYKGVIGDGLGFNNLIIEAKGDELWESGKIEQMTKEKIDYIIYNYDDLIKRIKPAVERNKRMAMKQIEEVAAIINSQSE